MEVAAAVVRAVEAVVEESEAAVGADATQKPAGVETPAEIDSEMATEIDSEIATEIATEITPEVTPDIAEPLAERGEGASMESDPADIHEESTETILQTSDDGQVEVVDGATESSKEGLGEGEKPPPPLDAIDADVAAVVQEVVAEAENIVLAEGRAGSGAAAAAASSSAAGSGERAHDSKVRPAGGAEEGAMELTAAEELSPCLAPRSTAPSGGAVPHAGGGALGARGDATVLGSPTRGVAAPDTVHMNPLVAAAHVSPVGLAPSQDAASAMAVAPLGADGAQNVVGAHDATLGQNVVGQPVGAMALGGGSMMCPPWMGPPQYVMPGVFPQQLPPAPYQQCQGAGGYPMYAVQHTGQMVMMPTGAPIQSFAPAGCAGAIGAGGSASALTAQQAQAAAAAAVAPSTAVAMGPGYGRALSHARVPRVLPSGRACEVKRGALSLLGDLGDRSTALTTAYMRELTERKGETRELFLEVV